MQEDPELSARQPVVVVLWDLSIKLVEDFMPYQLIQSMARLGIFVPWIFAVWDKLDEGVHTCPRVPIYGLAADRIRAKWKLYVHLREMEIKIDLKAFLLKSFGKI
jgi:hypothetical protein